MSYSDYNANSNNTFTQRKAWHEKKWLIALWCIFLFPVGLHGLWKNTSIAPVWKITVTVFITVLVLANIGSDEQPTTSRAKISISEPTKTHQEWVEVYSFSGNGMKKSPVF